MSTSTDLQALLSDLSKVYCSFFLFCHFVYGGLSLSLYVIFLMNSQKLRIFHLLAAMRAEAHAKTRITTFMLISLTIFDRNERIE
jgi:hypothetical protein